MKIHVKRVYEAATKEDGTRILVDRLWPRGLSKEKGKIDTWVKELSPSSELRQWYNHDPDKWSEFKERYFRELKKNNTQIEELLSEYRHSEVTFLFSSKELALNNAFALKEYLESKQK